MSHIQVPMQQGKQGKKGRKASWQGYILKNVHGFQGMSPCQERSVSSPLGLCFLTEHESSPYWSSSSVYSVIQFSSVTQSYPTLRPHGLHAAHQASLFITNSWSLLRLMSIQLVMPSNHLILSSPSPPSILPGITVFSSESVLHMRWPKYWNFNFSITPSYEYSGLISFRMDWWNLLAVQRILKCLLQHHNLKASVLWHSALLRVQLSLPYMTTGETIALTRWTFVSKVMSLLVNMLSRFFITFLPRSKRLLISSAVILEPPKIKSVTVSIVSPSICHEVLGPDAKSLAFLILSFKPTFSLSPFHFHQEAL